MAIVQAQKQPGSSNKQAKMLDISDLDWGEVWKNHWTMQLDLLQYSQFPYIFTYRYPVLILFSV